MPAILSQSADSLLIVALTARALAESARRAGIDCIAIDAFADADTRTAAAGCVPVAWNERGPESLECVLPNPTDVQGLVFGGGLEASPEWLDAWFLARKLIGNRPDSLRRVNNPRSFFTLLDELGVAHPEVCYSVPPQRQGWLIKRAARSGGGHVRSWTGIEDISSDDYFQRRLQGPVMSVLFLADGERAQVVGWNTQWARGGGDYLWGGAMNHADLSPGQRSILLTYVESLVTRLRLRGLNSLDFMLEGGRPNVLELNPRPGATLELYDRDFNRGLLYWHVQACQGRLPQPADRYRQVKRACQVVYTRQQLAVPGRLKWAQWCHDLPTEGVTLQAGDPVCTVTASGDDPSTTLRCLKQRETRIQQQLLSWRQVA